MVRFFLLLPYISYEIKKTHMFSLKIYKIATHHSSESTHLVCSKIPKFLNITVQSLDTGKVTNIFKVSTNAPQHKAPPHKITISLVGEFFKIPYKVFPEKRKQFLQYRGSLQDSTKKEVESDTYVLDKYKNCLDNSMWNMFSKSKCIKVFFRFKESMFQWVFDRK